MGRRIGGVLFKGAILNEMLDLREQGWSYIKLSYRYNCDYTTIIYWCQKLGVVPLVTTKIKATFKDNSNNNYDMDDLKYPEEKVREGKSYVEYLKEESQRNNKKWNKVFKNGLNKKPKLIMYSPLSRHKQNNEE